MYVSLSGSFFSKKETRKLVKKTQAKVFERDGQKSFRKDRNGAPPKMLRLKYVFVKKKRMAKPKRNIKNTTRAKGRQK